MSDQERRRKERAMRNGGGVEDANRAGAALARQTGVLSQVVSVYKDKWVYVEGARMNYVAHVSDIILARDGELAAFATDQLFRVGDWNANGINTSYLQKMPASTDTPRLLPWSAIDEMGLAPQLWVKQCLDHEA